MTAKKAKREKIEDATLPTLTVTAGKRRAFRWLAGLVAPVVVILGIELGLRLAGCGYPTHFFVRSETRSPDLFIENPKFGWSYFPRRMARAPDPIRLTKTKPPGIFRIFVLGESAALGDPEPAYGFSRILRELLEERCPETKFEVVNVAMTAINSHVILRIARDCVPFAGDIWIIYMGNNEVIGPFGAGSVFGSKSPPSLLIRAGLLSKRTCLGQMLDGLLQRAPAQNQEFRQWEGMKMMLKDQIRASDPLLERVYEHFARNLTDILTTAKRAGVKPIVCSVSSNLKDCPPFASLHRPGLPEARQGDWARWLASGTELESRKDYAQALEHYRQAAGIDDTHAALRFRMGRCYAARGEGAVAREQFDLARDYDALRFRVDTPINDIIRRVCASHAPEGVRFFNSEAAVTNACQQGIPGEECFWDHVHFNFNGNYRVACGLADQVLSLLPEPARRSAEINPRYLTETECAERLAFTDWDRRLVLEQMWRRVHEPPFTGQLDHEQLLARWSGVRTELERQTRGEGLAMAVPTYRRALKRRDDDWVLHHRFAALLEASGDYSGAEQHWKRVIEMVPGYPDACFKLGDISARQSKLIEAAQYYLQVLRLRPNSFEAMNGLGLVRMAEDRLDEAVRWFGRALEIEPKFAEAHVNWGLLLSRRGMKAEAEAHYREALECNPESAGAHINLGNLLAAQKKHPEAIDHYLEALKLQPKEATVHLGLANSLEAVGRNSEAVAHYREAVLLNPALAEAHFNLGVAMAKQGDLLAATTCFQEAVRLNPEDAQARLSLGVALAQQSRLREAMVQFQAVLRLDPANEAAKQYLHTATAREGSKP